MAKTIKRLLELEAQLKYHDYMYFDQSKPVISDDEYEILSHEYHSLRSEFPDYTTDYAMGFVRVDPSLEKVKIEHPMLSIVKKKTKSDFNAWIKSNIKNDKVYEDKLDGMALRLIYQDGELSRIHTRGTGDTGGDISHRRHLLLNVPDVIEADVNKGRTEYTGEAFCLYSDFDEYVKKYNLDPEDTDPRSTVSGLMKRHKATDRDDLPIHFKVYAASPNVRKEFDSYLTLRKYFTSVGFDVPKLIPGEEINDWLDLTTKPIEEYPIDGIVVKDNDLRAWDVQQGVQYWSYAACFKFPTIALETKCVTIDWSLKLDGELVGTLIYEPVFNMTEQL